MKIVELLTLMLISIMAVFFIVRVKLVEDTLVQRTTDIGDFTEFGILFLLLILVIAYAVSKR